MAKRSDFAQKLLDDLRLRKERMAASQSSKGTNSMVADAYAYSKRTYKGSMEIKTPENNGFRIGNGKVRSDGGNKSLTTGQASNQIVPFGRGQKSEPVDLSSALAFALENAGKLRMDSSGNSVLSFLHQISRRPRERRNSVLDGRQPSNSHLPNLSYLHIEEISKGAQKLNQILRACSNGLNFDGYSIEIGKELLKGAIDLEESLRMLVNLQEASEYMTTPRRKSHLTLLEEDEDDDDDNTVKVVDQRQLDKPIFSFDKRSRKYQDIQEIARTDIKLRLAALTYSSDASNFNHEKQVLAASSSSSHKRSMSYGPDLKNLSTFSEPNHLNSSQSKQGKGRIPNVIAKLMGLDEVPGNVDSKYTTKKEAGSKQKIEGVVSKKPTQESRKKAEQRKKDTRNMVLPAEKQNAIQAREISITGDTVMLQSGKNHATRTGSSVAFHDKPLPWKDLEDKKPGTGSRKANIMIDKEQGNVIQLNNGGSRKDMHEKDRKQDNTKYREQKGTERSESQESGFKDELQQVILNSHKREATLTLQEKTDFKERLVQAENSYANRILLSNQQKPQNFYGFQQADIPSKAEPQEKRRRTEEMALQNAKQKLHGRQQKGNEHMLYSLSQPMQSESNNQKKQPQMNQAAPSRKDFKGSIDAMQFEQLPNGRYHEDLPSDSSPSNLNVKMKDSMTRNSSQISSQGDLGSESRKSGIPSALEDKAVQVQSTLKAKNVKVTKPEIRRKINEVMAKKSGTTQNLPKPLKHQNLVSQEGNQRLREKLHVSREIHQVKVGKSKEVEAQAQIIKSNRKTATTQPSSIAQELKKQAKEDSILCSPLEDQCQSINEPQASVLNDSCENVISVVTNDRQGREPVFSRDEGLKFHESVSNPLGGTHEASTEISYPSQLEQQKISKSEMQEPLTENENHLKQILIKSQLFLNTAEALFKLNIPFGILHDSGHDSQEECSKVTLDCGYEMMKRKGRRQELSVHPFMKVSITPTKVRTLDGLVKQLQGDFEKLKFYGRDGSFEVVSEDYIPKILEIDVRNKDPDLNCMWDLGWSDKMFAFLEKDDVIRDAEKYVLNGLLDDLTRDLCTVISIAV